MLEGNRRFLCAKLLKNPTLIHTFQMPDAFRKRLEKASQKFDIKTIEPVDCYEVADRAEGNNWIRQRHTGEDAGSGVVGWSAIASKRFAGRDPAFQALEFVLKHGNLSDDQAERVNTTKFISTLDGRLSVRSDLRFLCRTVCDHKDANLLAGPSWKAATAFMGLAELRLQGGLLPH